MKAVILNDSHFGYKGDSSIIELLFVFFHKSIVSLHERE